MTNRAAANMPDVGQAAPAFYLPSDTGEKIRLSSYKGEKNVVLYFYPRDNTPGCTKEACAFQDDLVKFKRQDTVVLGVSADPLNSHEKFRAKFNLKFPLLADEDTKVAQKYGVWVEKNMYGHKKMGIQRATFLIDKKGKIARVWPRVKVDGHAQEVYQAVRELS